MKTHSTFRIHQRGLSLIELMIAMLLGIFIVGGMGALFVQNKASYRQDEQVARMQEDARFALNAIIDDVEMIGFWADVHEPANVGKHASLTIDAAKDCGGGASWVYTATLPVVRYDDSGTSVSTTFDCITDGQTNSDAIAINRVLGSGIDLSVVGAALEANVVYMKSNGAGGLLLTSMMADTTITGTPINYWQYLPTLYYVRDYANTDGDGIPTLCVFELSSTATPAMVETCLAQGVESLQIEYGIDTNTDGVANIYVSAPSAAQVQSQLVSVRVQLLMRAVDPDPNYVNGKTYSLGDYDGYTPNDNFYRRVYTTTVLVRNTRNLRCVNLGC